MLKAGVAARSLNGCSPLSVAPPAAARLAVFPECGGGSNNIFFTLQLGHKQAIDLPQLCSRRKSLPRLESKLNVRVNTKSNAKLISLFV